MSLIDNTSRDLLVELTFMSNVKKFEKINVANKSFDNGWLSPIFRWWNGENKEKTLQYITETLSKAIEHVTTLRKDEDKNSHVIEMMMNGIKKNRDGIAILKDTYEGHPYMAARITVLLESIDTFIKSTD